MLSNFRAYQLAVELYKECKQAAVPAHLKDQLVRASSSVALNLSEGYGRKTKKDRHRFFNYSFGSIREVQAIIQLEDLSNLRDKADHVAACVYKLTH